MQLKDIYDEAKERFGVHSSLWSMSHLTFSPYTFGGVNKKELIFEYLFWESLIPQMKDENLPYYQGIDSFLKEYKKAVYNSLNMDTLGA